MRSSGSPLSVQGLQGIGMTCWFMAVLLWLTVDFISCPDKPRTHCCYSETIVSPYQHMITLCVMVRIWGRRLEERSGRPAELLPLGGVVTVDHGGAPAVPEIT